MVQFPVAAHGGKKAWHFMTSNAPIADHFDFDQWWEYLDWLDVLEAQ